jgi:hypothetical protein
MPLCRLSCKPYQRIENLNRSSRVFYVNLIVTRVIYHCYFLNAAASTQKAKLKQRIKSTSQTQANDQLQIAATKQGHIHQIDGITFR